MLGGSTPGDRTLGVVAVVLFATILGGLAGADAPSLGDGTADVQIASPSVDRLPVEPGRFGSAARYVRVPDLVADVSRVDGHPRLQYRVAVPGIDVDRHRSRLLEGAGRLRLHLPDVALPPPGSGPSSGTYRGRIVVAVQSFSTDHTVLNRTVTVRVSQR